LSVKYLGIMRLLIVGGAGYVGGIVRTALEQAHDCTHFDLQPVPGTSGKMIVGDVNDEQAVAAAVTEDEGGSFDSILYMPLGTGGTERVNAGHTGAAFAVNVCGCYRFLRHGLAAGVRRFVYISSLSVYNQLLQRSVSESVETDSWNPYGLSKRAGEFVCQAAAQAHPQASILALRLMFPRNESDWPQYRFDPSKEKKSFAIGPEDVRRLFLAAVGFSQPGFHVVQATGDVEGQTYSTLEARRLLGWSPQNE
jgi:2-alkyl-3-oxoalkanoate reductase